VFRNQLKKEEVKIFWVKINKDSMENSPITSEFIMMNLHETQFTDGFIISQSNFEADGAIFVGYDAFDDLNLLNFLHH
jgi:hypothetical protein